MRMRSECADVDRDVNYAPGVCVWAALVAE